MGKVFKYAFIVFLAGLFAVASQFFPMFLETVSAATGVPKDVKEGDVIFQTSQSQQSPLIQVATQSKISHCGVIVMKGGKPYVLETLKTLKLTPLRNFIERGKGGEYWLKRPKKDDIKIKYDKYLGLPYDLAFKFDNGKFYCSELVYDIYKNQLGIELCKPKKVGDYFVAGTEYLPVIKRVMKKRKIETEQLAVAPVDVFESDLLFEVSK